MTNSTCLFGQDDAAPQVSPENAINHRFQIFVAFGAQSIRAFEAKKSATLIRCVMRQGVAPMTHQIRTENVQLLDEKTLAARWAISPRTLQNRRVAGHGVPFIKIGRSVRYRLSDIIAFEEGGRRHSTSEGQRS